jgi:hypothetical protein
MAEKHTHQTEAAAEREQGAPLPQPVIDAEAREAALAARAAAEHEARLATLEAPTPAQAANAPRAYFNLNTTYITQERDFRASSVGLRVTSYTFDNTTVAADSNGDKIVYEGTVLSATAGGKAQPRTGAQTAIGILSRRINVRDADADIAMLIAGAVRQDKLYDNGGFGAVAASVKTDLPFVQFVSYDV